jgi:hypothetical protein
MTLILLINKFFKVVHYFSNFIIFNMLHSTTRYYVQYIFKQLVSLGLIFLCSIIHGEPNLERKDPNKLSCPHRVMYLLENQDDIIYMEINVLPEILYNCNKFNSLYISKA